MKKIIYSSLLVLAITLLLAKKSPQSGAQTDINVRFVMPDAA